MNNIKDHLSEANTFIKQVDPNEENESLNNAIASLILAKDEISMYEDKKKQLLNELENL